MEKRLEKEFTISSYELNPRGEARLTTIANYFQEVAYQHAGRLGLGYGDMKRNNSMWLLSRMRISMNTYPKWDDTIRVETWPSGMDRLFACRDFRVTDSGGGVLGRGTTNWLIADLQNHRPKRPGAELEEFFRSIVGEAQYPDRLGKIHLPGKMSLLQTHRVLFSDLDIVGHANNVKYIEWCIDAATEARGETAGIADFEINFMHETRSGEEVEIHGGIMENNSQEESPADGELQMFCQGLVTGDGREAFRARIQWAC